jgi:hypothetical protein
MMVVPAGPALPKISKISVTTRPRGTNFPCLTFSWAPQVLANNAIIEYDLFGGNSDDTTRWFWSFPASNNSLTIGVPGKEPCWFQVELVDQFGNISPPTPRFYTNVPVWPRITAYSVHGTNYVGWWAGTNHGWSVLAMGSTNPIFTIKPSSNMLVHAALPMNTPGVWYRVLEQ